MKKTMAMLLSAAMVMSMGLMASAATQDYSVLVDGDKLTLTNGETRAVYQLDESRLVLSQSSEGGIAVSFSVEDEENKKVTLGSQKDVTVSGDLYRLNISQSLDKEYNIYLDKNADVRDLVSNGDARITVDGEVTRAYLRSGSARLTANSSSDVEVVYAENANSVKGLLNHQVKPYEDGPAIDTVSGNSSSTTRRYYRSYRSDLGVSGVYDRGDRISFECDVAGATVRLNGERIGTTSRGDNTFRIDEDDRDWNDRLTISKDGYDTETIYLDDYYGHYRYSRYSRRGGFNYWRA